MSPSEAAPETEPRVSTVNATSSPLRAPDLLSSVCHDLKDPLASIVMGAGFLRRALSPEDAAAQRVVEAIHRAADRMSQLITNFSDLARLEMHDLTLELQPQDIGALVTTAFEKFATDAAAQVVEVSLEVEPGLPTLACDRQRVLQILGYLGASALRVVPEGGTIVVAARSEDQGPVRIEVVARRRPGPSSRRIVSEPPKPALALARGLLELHGAGLHVAGDEDALRLSFALQRAP
jgi:signal transduction histidine kinase